MKISENEINKYNQLDLLQTGESTNGNTTYDLLDTCAYKNCFFTCNKSLAADADALLIHDTYGLSNNFNRSASQLLIFWNDEANQVDKRLDQFKFNWTISFKQESEASYCTYGCYAHNKIKLKYLNFLKLIRKEFIKREKTSVWFVSNCNSEYRLNYAVQLARTFNLTIYGSCKSSIESKLKLERNKYLMVLNDGACGRDSQCEAEALLSNKYFLSFENSNCSSYVTEKFWRSLRHGIIPVVIQPDKQFYEALAPADSFIHASDFDYDTVKLTAYLNKASNDFQTYFKHLKWKYTNKALYDTKTLERNRICELCYKLNTYGSLEYYNSISDYFNNDCHRN